MLTGPGPGCGLPPRCDKTCVVLGVDWPEFIEIKPTDQFSMLSIVGHILPFPARKCLVVANQFLATLIYIISSLPHDIDLRVCMAVQLLGYLILVYLLDFWFLGDQPMSKPVHANVRACISQCLSL